VFFVKCYRACIYMILTLYPYCYLCGGKPRQQNAKYVLNPIFVNVGQDNKNKTYIQCCFYESKT